MITLAKYGPAFDLPDLSSFVMKAEILLRMAGLDYTVDQSSAAFRKAPKGKMPYIVDDGVPIPDSTFIRFHLERKYGIDFDAGLSRDQRALGWAFEKMVEDHLYWAVIHSRWIEDANFEKVKSVLLPKLPPVLGPVIAALARRGVRSDLRSQGFGRHTPEEIYELGRRDLAALSDTLADKPFLHGPEPKAADAAVGGLLIALFSDAFRSPLDEAGRGLPNLVAYAERMRTRFFAGERALAA
jgi:glutathione S-transferase